jgi:hypothetical protein
MTNNIPASVNHVGDGAAVTTLGAWFFGILPDVATLFTVIWLGLRIYESDTVQKLIRRRKK